MKIAFLSTRINGSDGVSLEIDKWARILTREGHQIFYAAGELGNFPNKQVIPEMHFKHAEILRIQEMAFGRQERSDELSDRIMTMAERLEETIRRTLDAWQIELVIAENILTIPMNIPLAIALTRIIRQRDLATIAHHHDFYWERERFKDNQIPEILKEYFPPKHPAIQHVVINSIAQGALKERTGLDADIIPNIFEFEQSYTVDDATVARLRASLGIQHDEMMVLQPTRIVPRKGIELAIDLVVELRREANLKRLGKKDVKLVFSHPSGDEGDDYLSYLLERAKRSNVPVVQAAHVFSLGLEDGDLTNLWDAYHCADLVTYPSYVEGFGNALLEALCFRKMVVINRYPVYVRDIRPLGFELIEMDGEVTPQVVERVMDVMTDESMRKEMAARNHTIAKEHYSFPMAQQKLDTMIGVAQELK